jgi:hypothetical protein
MTYSEKIELLHKRLVARKRVLLLAPLLEMPEENLQETLYRACGFGMVEGISAATGVTIAHSGGAIGHLDEKLDYIISKIFVTPETMEASVRKAFKLGFVAGCEKAGKKFATALEGLALNTPTGENR